MDEDRPPDPNKSPPDIQIKSHKRARTASPEISGEDRNLLHPSGGSKGLLLQPGGDGGHPLPSGGDKGLLPPSGGDGSLLLQPGGDGGLLLPSSEDRSLLLSPGEDKNKNVKKNICNYYANSNKGPYEVHVNHSKGEPIHPVKFGNLLYRGGIKNILEDGIKVENRYKLSIKFQSLKSANQFIDSPFLKDNNLNAYIPTYRLFKQGIVKRIPVDLSEGEIIDCIQVSAGFGRVSKVRRLNRKEITDGKVEWKASTTCVLSFEGQHLPSKVFLFYNALPVEIYEYPTILCHRCARFGHTKTKCTSPSPKCAKCSSTEHSKDKCPSEKDLLCPNCNGKHEASSANCPELIRQRTIKSTMAKENMSFSQAAKTIPRTNKVLYSRVVSTKKPENKQVATKPYLNRKEYIDNLMYENGQPCKLRDGFALNNTQQPNEISSTSTDCTDTTKNINVPNLLICNIAKILMNIINSQDDNYAVEALPFLKSIIENGSKPRTK
jgi:hypothetical protein